MNSLLYEIERLISDKKQLSTITDAQIILTKIQNKILKMENPPRLDFSLSQRIQQMSQVQPENLTPEDRKLLTEYQQKEESFEQGPLSECNNRIKKNLGHLLILFQSNAFLRKMSEK